MKSKFDGFYRARLKSGLHEITLPCPAGFVGARIITQDPDDSGDAEDYAMGEIYGRFKDLVLDQEGEFTSNDFPDFDVHTCRIYLMRMEKRGLITKLPHKRSTSNGKRGRVYVYVVA